MTATATEPTLKPASNKVLAALQFAASKGLDVDDAVDQLSDLVEAVQVAGARRALVSIKTVIGKGTNGKPLVVGWDVCGECTQHISNCACPSGPHQPSYVAKFLAEIEARPDGPAKSGGHFESAPAAGAAEAGTPTAVSSKKSGPSCLSCHKPVSEENADKNDDGTWTCWVCQAEPSSPVAT